MNEDVQSLFKRHDAFYEVSPYYVVAMRRRVQAGFDVDVYAARTDHADPFMPPPKEYARGSAALAAIAKQRRGRHRWGLLGGSVSVSDEHHVRRPGPRR